MKPSEMQLQRDQALGCMILALGVSLAVFLSAFGKADALALAGARETVTVHERLLRDTDQALKQNQDALIQARTALEAIRQSRRR